MTSSASFTSSVAASTDSGSTLLRCRKIRIYPDVESRKRLKRYFGLARYWYNQAVEWIKENRKTVPVGTLLRLLTQQKEHPSWAFECPQRVRLHAVADAVKAARSAGANSLRFRRKKDSRQSVGFDKQSLSPGHVWAKLNSRITFRASENIPTPATEGCRIVFERGRYFIAVPVEVPCRISREPRRPVVALDPGIRTFLTYFGGDVHGKIGEGAASRLLRLAFALDRLLSKAAKAPARRRYRMLRAADRIRCRIADLQADLHWKAAAFLCSRFETILLPAFSAKHFVLRKARKLRNKEVRRLLGLGFGKFRQRLLAVAQRYGTKVILVNESWTSKTCSYCGRVIEVGSRRVFECPGCHVAVDRDYNGARGIYLAGVAGSRLIRVLHDPDLHSCHC